MEYIDLFSAFREKTKGDNIYLFRKSDRHWNEKGHALAAKKCSPLLIRKDISKQRSD